LSFPQCPPATKLKSPYSAQCSLASAVSLPRLSPSDGTNSVSELLNHSPALIGAKLIVFPTPIAVLVYSATLYTPAASLGFAIPNPRESATTRRYRKALLTARIAAGTVATRVSTIRRIPPRPGSTAITSHSHSLPGSFDLEVA
jgi:hypothetical protein